MEQLLRSQAQQRVASVTEDLASEDRNDRARPAERGLEQPLRFCPRVKVGALWFANARDRRVTRERRRVVIASIDAGPVDVNHALAGSSDVDVHKMSADFEQATKARTGLIAGDLRRQRRFVRGAREIDVGAEPSNVPIQVADVGRRTHPVRSDFAIASPTSRICSCSLSHDFGSCAMSVLYSTHRETIHKLASNLTRSKLAWPQNANREPAEANSLLHVLCISTTRQDPQTAVPARI